MKFKGDQVSKIKRERLKGSQSLNCEKILARKIKLLQYFDCASKELCFIESSCSLVGVVMTLKPTSFSAGNSGNGSFPASIALESERIVKKM